MSDGTCYVEMDGHGAMRVGGTRVLLDSVIAAFHQGHSAETIQQQYPTLSLEHVYGAITYYLGHKHDVHQYLRRQEDLWNDWKTKSGEASGRVVQRLRALKAADATEAS